jgi:hypothetical protein
LLASLADCVAQRAFGYPLSLRPTLQAISHAEAMAEAAAASQNIFEGPNGDYEKLRRDFVEGGVATDTLDTYEYYFRLTLNGVAPPAVSERAPWLLEIVDAAGELAVPPEGARVAILNDVKDKFAGQMLGAQAIVFVLPMVRSRRVRKSWMDAAGRHHFHADVAYGFVFLPISARASGEVMEMRPFLASASGSPTICHTAFLSVSSSTSVTVAPNLMVSPDSLDTSMTSARASLSSSSAMRPSLCDCASLAA